MVSDEGTIHPADFNLKHIFQETSSDQVKIFSFETFVKSLFDINLIISVQLIVLDIIANWSASP